MLLVLLESGDEVVRVPAVPAELVLLQGRDVDVLPEKDSLLVTEKLELSSLNLSAS